MTMKLRNHYYIMRHGEALSNVRNVVSCWPETFNNSLTTKGKKDIKASVENLKNKNVSLIFHSPLKRARMSAEIAGKVLKFKNLPAGRQVKPDKRLREVQFGIYNGRHLEGMWESFKNEEERIHRGIEGGGETYKEILDRMLDFLREVDETYSGRNVLIISHEGPLFLLQGKTMGLTLKETIERFPPEVRPHKAEIRELN